MEPDADQAWVEFERSLSDMTRNSDMIGVIQAAYRAGYRAALEASPSEELESWDGLMEQLDRHYPADLMANWPDDPGPRIVALIRQIDAIRRVAALRTTKEGEDD